MRIQKFTKFRLITEIILILLKIIVNFNALTNTLEQLFYIKQFIY